MNKKRLQIIFDETTVFDGLLMPPEQKGGSNVTQAEKEAIIRLSVEAIEKQLGKINDESQ